MCRAGSIHSESVSAMAMGKNSITFSNGRLQNSENDQCRNFTLLFGRSNSFQGVTFFNRTNSCLTVTDFAEGKKKKMHFSCIKYFDCPELEALKYPSLTYPINFTKHFKNIQSTVLSPDLFFLLFILIRKTLFG